MVYFEKIPFDLRLHRQWLLWDGDKKIPYQTNGDTASVSDPNTWNHFDAIRERFNSGGYRGIGYVLADSDEFCGIDLDGCRDPKTGEVAEWAREIILKFDSYSEVSPSKTGVKIFVRAKSPIESGKKTSVKDAPLIAGKQPAVELYDHVRYFAVTGDRLSGVSPEVEDRQEQVNELAAKFWPEQPTTPSVDYYSDSAVVDRARKYVAKMPPAISGDDGHKAAFRVACVLVRGFGLSPEGDALTLLREYSQICQPPWSDRELLHKVRSATQVPGPMNYLRNVQPGQWSTVTIPHYEEPAPKPQPKVTTLVDASRRYVEMVGTGTMDLLSTGLADLDYAIGGGVEPGEVIVVGARSGHGKSAFSLQWVHNWTAEARPALIITEEMPAHLFGKRTLQYTSDLGREHWKTSIHRLDDDIAEYAETHAPCYIVEMCGTAEVAIEQMNKFVNDHGVRLVVVDYAQQLESQGKTRYEQVTKTSRALTMAAKQAGVTLLMLCQMSRAIESRPKYVPQMSDLKESGQFEQDADMILFLVWPHKIDEKSPPNEYKIYVAKNRNRETNQAVVRCKFWPMRQMVVPEPPKKAQEMRNYSPALAEWSK